MRELLKVEVLYNTLSDYQLPKSLGEVWAMWQNFIRTLVVSYANRLPIMSWIDTESMDRLAKQLQEYEDYLTSLQWPWTLTVEKLIRILSEQLKERCSACQGLKLSQGLSYEESAFLYSRERLLMTYIVCNPLILPVWLGDDRKKWGGQPSWTLEARIQELQVKKTANRHQPGKLLIQYQLSSIEGLIIILTQKELLVCSYRIQVINAPAWNRRVLPFARRRKGRTGFTGKCKHHVNCYQRYGTAHAKPNVEYDLSRLDYVANFPSSHSVW